MICYTLYKLKWFLGSTTGVSIVKNKVALVTGSGSGIGLAIAHGFAEAGINVALHGLLPEHEGAQLVQEFEDRYSRKTFFSSADLRDANAIAKLLARTNQEMGHLDILVNNAGIQHTASLEDFPTQQWNDIIAVNLSAAFHTIQHALPLMKNKGWGRIINIASVHGLVASINKCAYVAAKHGIIGLTKVVALENASQGITCNSICPGWVDTPLIAQQIEQHAQNQGIEINIAKQQLISSKQPMAVMTQPTSVAQMALFLCSENADTITGASLPMDGGWTAQ